MIKSNGTINLLLHQSNMIIYRVFSPRGVSLHRHTIDCAKSKSTDIRNSEMTATTTVSLDLARKREERRGEG